MSDKRAAIIQLHRAGKTNSEILKLLKAPRSTVYHTVSRFKELQSTDDRPRSGRPRSSRTPKVINAVKARIRRNPKRSMRAMARDMNVSEKTIRNIVKIDLKMSSFKMQTRQYLTDLQKEKKTCSSEDSSQQVEGRYGHRRDHFLWWKVVHCRVNLQPTKWQSPSKIICRHSWLNQKRF